MVSRELEKECVVVFDEAHNIDNVCIEALSVNLRQQTLNAARRNIQRLEGVRAERARARACGCGCSLVAPCSSARAAAVLACIPAPSASSCPLMTAMPTPASQEVRKAQAANRARLDDEYRRLVGSLVDAQQLRGGEEWLANPALPEDIVRESMPGVHAPALLAAGPAHRRRTRQSACGRVRVARPCRRPRTVRGQRARARMRRAEVLTRIRTHACNTAGNIRRAEHFIGFLRRFVAHLAERMKAPVVVSESPATFLAGVQRAVAVDAKTLR